MENIGTIDEFPEGKGTRVNVDGIEIAVFNLEGTLYGIQNLCPHKRLPLHYAGHSQHPRGNPLRETVPGKEPRGVLGEVDAEEGVIRCPWHRLKFDIESGTIPATNQRIATYDIEVRDGDVFVEL